MRVCKSRKSTHSVMANQGFGEVRIIRKGEEIIRLSIMEQSQMTVEEAMRLNREGKAVIAV